MKTTLHIQPLFNCNIHFFCGRNEIFSLNSMGSLQEEIDLNLLNGEDFEIKIYPFNKKGQSEKIAYTAKFYFDHNVLLSNSKQVKIYALPQNHFYIKILPVKIGNLGFEDYDKIESEQGKIKTLKILPTLTKKGEIEVFETNGDLPSLIEKYYVKLKEDNLHQNIDGLQLVEFFENIKFGEKELLKENLTAALSERLTYESIVKFFGQFEDIKLVNYYDQPAVILLYPNNKARVFSANFNKSLIDNVFEIE